MTKRMTGLTMALLLLWSFTSGIFAAEMVVVEVRKATADDVFKMMKALAESDRKVLIEKNIKMSKQEREKFWPIYSSYRKDISQIDVKEFNLIKDFAKNYQTLSDKKAAQLLDLHLKSKREKLTIRQKYLKDFRKTMPAKKVARFYQVENKLNAIINVRLAEEIPLVK